MFEKFINFIDECFTYIGTKISDVIMSLLYKICESIGIA